MTDWRNDNNIELAKLKPTKHLETKLPLYDVIVEEKIDGHRYSFEIGAKSWQNKLVGRNRAMKTYGVDVASQHPFKTKDMSNTWVHNIQSNAGLFVFDGELVVDTARSTSSDTSRKDTPKKYIIFDILVYKNVDIREKSLAFRKTCLPVALACLEGSGIKHLEIIEISRSQMFDTMDLEIKLNYIQTSSIEGLVIKPASLPYEKNTYGWKIKVTDTEDGYIFTWRREIKHHLGKRVRTNRVGSVGVAQNNAPNAQQVVTYVALPEKDRCSWDDAANTLFRKVIEFSHLGWDGNRFSFPQFIRWREDKSAEDCVFTQGE